MTLKYAINTESGDRYDTTFVVLYKNEGWEPQGRARCQVG